MNKDITLEDLDFELIKDDSNNDNPLLRTLCYKGKNSIDNTWWEIVFELKDKEVDVYRCDEHYRIIKQRTILTIPMLQAIYNKCKELGWFR